MKVVFPLIFSVLIFSLSIFVSVDEIFGAIYVKIPGVEGDVKTQGYEGFFEADSFSFSVEREK